MKALVSILIILSFSCKSQNQNSIPLEMNNDRLTLLIQDGYFFTDTLITEVIRDEKTLKAFFSKVNITRKPGLPIPEVDFSKEIIFIVCMGEQQTTAMPFLTILKEDEQELTIGIKFGGSSENNNPITSYPFCVYKMPVFEKKVIFKSI